MKTESKNQHIKQELIKQCANILTNACETLSKIYIQSSDEIDIEALMDLKHFRSLIERMVKEIK